MILGENSVKGLTIAKIVREIKSQEVSGKLESKKEFPEKFPVLFIPNFNLSEKLGKVVTK